MANNPVFKKIILKDVELAYPRLDQTHRYDSQEQRSEQCNPTAAGAAWSVSFTLSSEDAKKLFVELRDHYNACKQNDASLGDFGTVFGMKKLDSGLVSFRAKKNGTNRKGDLNQPPIVIDAFKQPLENKAIWTGSIGTLRMIAFPSKSPQTGEGGISLLLDAVQILDPVYGGDGLDDFEAAPAPSAMQSEDPFGLPPAKPAGIPDDRKQPAADPFSMDDEIPF